MDSVCYWLGVVSLAVYGILGTLLAACFLVDKIAAKTRGTLAIAYFWIHRKEAQRWIAEHPIERRPVKQDHLEP